MMLTYLSPSYFVATIARMGLDVTNVAASLAMPVESTNPPADNKMNQSVAATSAAVQAAAQQVLQNRVAEAQQVTGVTLPSFYNPAAVNPMKYAQQIQKRKLLWSNKVNNSSLHLFFVISFRDIIFMMNSSLQEKNEPPATSTAKLWEATAFTQDQDGKMTAKFKRLMGIKHDPSEGGKSNCLYPSGIACKSLTRTSSIFLLWYTPEFLEEMSMFKHVNNIAGPSAVEDQPESASDVLKKQQELFASLDQQYQVARATTHTQRGLGLGFSSNPRWHFDWRTRQNAIELNIHVYCVSV